MYYIVYQTKNLVNGKTYVGVHKTKNVGDGYMGCGVYSNISGDALRRKVNGNSAFPSAVKKHGVNNFEREILSFFDTYEEALEEESWIVDERWVKSENNYNVALGGNLGCKGWKMPEAQKKMLSDKFKGKFVSEQTKRKISNSLKGVKRSESTKKTISNIKTKYDLSKVYEEIIPFINQNLSESQIMKKTGYSKGTIYRAKNKHKNG